MVIRSETSATDHQMAWILFFVRSWRCVRAAAVTAAASLCCAACFSVDADPLQVVDQTHRIELLPGREIEAHLIQGGEPRWQGDATFALRNTGERCFLYILETTVPWLGVTGAASGMLRPGHSAAFELRLSVADALPVGEHVARLQVVNWVTFVSELEVVVRLRVSPRAVTTPGN